jgi:hypothetical protein
MFSFKARSISEPIADPIAAGTTIPTNAVIFMANNDMSTYASSSNWSFINMGQSDGTPSQIRGCTSVASANTLWQRTLLTSVNIITTSAGSHTGITYDGTTFTGYYYTEYFSGDNPNYPIDNKSSGDHTHSITGLSSSTNLGGKYPTSAVVSSYKCSATTKEIPKNAIIFAYSVQNEDFIPIDQFNRNSSNYGRFDGAGLLSGTSTWVATNAPFSANNGIYGTDLSNVVLNPTISTSGSHTHSTSPYGGNGSYTRYGVNDYRQIDTIGNGVGNPVHVHDANNMTASVSTKVIYLHAYRAVRNTSVYKGMILGWTGTNASYLPKGWYICNGQTINGVTTPQANTDAVIAMTSLKNFHGYIDGTDTLDVTYSIGGTQGIHSHVTVTYSGYRYMNGNIANNHKSYYSWNHEHVGTYSTAYKQAYFTLNFIIYLG